MRLAAFIVADMIVASAARADDFTGFYAGVNAGYGFGRDTNAHRHTITERPDAGNARDTDLPPSAAGAVNALRAIRTTTQQGPTAPR